MHMCFRYSLDRTSREIANHHLRAGMVRAESLGPDIHAQLRSLRIALASRSPGPGWASPEATGSATSGPLLPPVARNSASEQDEREVCPECEKKSCRPAPARLLDVAA